VGDGVTDDTAAFLAAAEALETGTLFVPDGLYRVSDVIQFASSNIAIRGESKERTIVGIDRSLDDLPSVPWPLLPGPPGGPFNHFGGFFYFGDVAGAGRPGPEISPVASDAMRGDFQLSIESSTNVRAGERVVLEMTDPGDGSLLRHIHGDAIEGSQAQRGSKLVRFVSDVAATSTGGVTLAQPLRLNVESRWQPGLFRHQPAARNVTLSNMTIEFLPSPTPRHHSSVIGRNAIAVFAVDDCLIQDVVIRNADNGVQLTDSHFCTIERVTLEATREANAEGHSGHHGFDIKGFSSSALVTQFFIDGLFKHDLSVASAANGNVFSAGSGVDLNFDHHKGANYENAFVDIDAGRGSRLWDSSGPPTGGPHTGTRNVYWNITAAQPLGLPPERTFTGDFPFGGHDSIFFGLAGPLVSDVDCTSRWIERPQQSGEPIDIAMAQQQRRERNGRPTNAPSCSPDR